MRNNSLVPASLFSLSIYRSHDSSFCCESDSFVVFLSALVGNDNES